MFRLVIENGSVLVNVLERHFAIENAKKFEKPMRIFQLLLATTIQCPARVSQMLRTTSAAQTMLIQSADSKK
jgi:hypothetical protein